MRINSKYTKNSSPTSHHHISATNPLRHPDPNLSDPLSPGLPASTSPSPAKRGLSPESRRLHCRSAVAGSDNFRVVYAQCSMSVSTKALCALVTKTLVVQLLGFLEPEVGGANMRGGEDVGYKCVRSVLLCDCFG